MTPMIEVTGIHKSYGTIEVLRDVGFSVAERETFAVIGPNGAGKSTLFKVVTGEAATNAGSVRYRGRDVTQLPAWARVRIGFGRTFQVARVFPEFTVRDNIVVALEARLRNTAERRSNRYDFRPARETVAQSERIAVQLGLERQFDTDARYLSHGDKKRLEIAIALALEPRVLMMDEPTAGMSPSDRKQTLALLKRLRAERGLTIVIVEHDMDLVFGLADRVMVLNYGQVVALGTVDEVRSNQMVREVYLGKETDLA